MSTKVTDLTQLFSKQLPDRTVGRIGMNDCIDISNGAADLSRSVSALLFIYEALENTNYDFDRNQIAESIILAVQKIEEVKMMLENIEIKE